MTPQFPGMDPWLEDPDLWPDVHNSLIAAIRDELMPKVLPRYVVRVESRATVCDGIASELLCLMIRKVSDRKVVTSIEVLSPTIKNLTDGRADYLRKRDGLMWSWVNLIEIDLLRSGEPTPVLDCSFQGDYRVLVCRPRLGGRGELYGFSYTTPIPDIPIPLLPGDVEPVLNLNQVLHSLVARARYDLSIDYRQSPQPPLRPEDEPWAAAIIAGASDQSSKE